MNTDELSGGRKLPEVNINLFGYSTTIDYRENKVATNAPEEKWCDIMVFLYDEGYIVDRDGKSIPTPPREELDAQLKECLEKSGGEGEST
jgi:hypothetical protein